VLAPLLIGVVVAVSVLWIRTVIVTGGSMEPVMGPGDVCLVVRGSRVEAGDIALLRRSGGRPVVHRVLNVAGDGSLVTKGDANPTPDREAIGPKAVIGRVALVVPVGTAARGWIRATLGATLLNQSE
jgi:signal peptidase